MDIVHFQVRFAALILTVYVLAHHAVHEVDGLDKQNTAVHKPGFQAFFPGQFGQMQLAADLGKSIARNIAADLGVANDASRFGNQFAFSETFSPNADLTDFQKRMDRPDLMFPIRAASVFPDADRTFSRGQVSNYGGGFPDGNYWNTDFWPAERTQPFNSPFGTIGVDNDFPRKKLVDSLPGGSSTNVDVADPVLGKQIEKSKNPLLEKSKTEIDSDVNQGDDNRSQTPRRDSDFPNKNSGPEFRPRRLGGRMRNNRRRFGVTRKSDRTTTEVSRDLTSRVGNTIDGVSDETLSEDGITASFTTTEVAKSSATEVIGDALADIDRDRTTGDNETIPTTSGNSDVSATTTEEVISFALSSLMEATTDRLCLPRAAEDMKLVLSSLAPSGSVAMTTLPKVVSNLVLSVQDAYPELSPSEVSTQVFTELCTALLHVLSYPPSAGSNVNYNMIPETAQIVSMMILSGFDV